MADLISSLVGKLFDYLAIPVGRQFGYLFRYNGNLQEFRSHLGELEMAGEAVKQRVEAAERNWEVILKDVENWLKRVDEVSNESQRFLGEEDAISKRCFNGPLNPKVRHQRSRIAKKQAAEFDRIKQAGRFDSVSVPAPPPPIGFGNNENEIDFPSRRSVFNEIMDAIKDDGVQMIGIWGMPGIGKTTLVKRVAKYAKDESLFEEVAMAVVSQEPSVKAIQDGIADRIGLKFTCDTEEVRADQLRQRLLAKKKILIILDDIWHRLELNDIGIPTGSQHKGCKLILTSRKRDVCEQMNTRKIFKIDSVSPDEALRLFLKMSGVDDRSSRKGQLAEELSKECGGLPLCIDVVARGLLKKETNDWIDMGNRLRSSDLDSDSKVRVAIESSYNKVVREEEKMFFLLCALFPEDYHIQVGRLFEYGIGLNLFKIVNNVDEALVRAHWLASRLKSSSLLLRAESICFYEDGEEDYVKMHDVVRDVAVAIASQGKNAFLVSPAVAQPREWQDKTAISLWNDDIINKLPDALECPRLQMLIMNCWKPRWHLPDNFFTGMKTLIVLDMEGMSCGRLPQSFSGLENLRTLRLRRCGLRYISTIGELGNLVSLSFEYSDITELPKKIGELSKLRLLDLTGCKIFSRLTIPGVIQNLSQLELLRMDRFFFENEIRDPNAVFSELIHLQCLMILEIEIPYASMLPDEVLFQKLTKFNISIGETYSFWMKNGGWDSQNFKFKCISKNELTKEGIKTLMKKAQRLELKDFPSISVALPSLQQLRLIDLPSLKEIWHCDHPTTTVGELSLLEVDSCGRLLEIFPSNLLAGVQNLKRLEVKSCASLEHVFAVKDHPPILSNLKELNFDNLPKLKQLWWNKNTCENFGLPSLARLEINKCPALQFVFDPSVGSCLKNLRCLDIRYCSSMVEIVAEKSGKKILLEDFPGISVALSSLQELHLFDLPLLKEIWHRGISGALPSLQKLHLFNLPLLKEIWHRGISDALPSLQALHLFNLPSLKEIWHRDHPATTVRELRVLKVELCDTPLEIFSSNLLAGVQNLETLGVRSCASLEHVFAVKDYPPILSNLQQLNFDHLPKLKQLWWNENTCENFGLPSLRDLTIDTCPALQFVFDPSVGSRLENLRSLSIKNCFSMVEIVAEKPGKKIEFPLLFNLKFRDLPCFKVNQSVEFPRAKYVVLENCFNMKKVCVEVERDRNFRSQGSISFFESLVEGKHLRWK